MASPFLITESMNRGGVGSLHIFVGQVGVVEMVADGNGTPDQEEGDYLKSGRLARRYGTIWRVVRIVSWFRDRQLVTSAEFFVLVQRQQFGWYKIRVCNHRGCVGLTGDEA